MEKIILAILYAIFGVILSAPYCYLAGWDDKAFPTMAMFLPIMLLSWYIFGEASQVFQYNGRRSININWRKMVGKDERKPIPFWIFTLYVLLPIIFNGLSWLIDILGFVTVSEIFYEYRYSSLISIPILSVIIFIVVIIFLELLPEKKTV